MESSALSNDAPGTAGAGGGVLGRVALMLARLPCRVLEILDGVAGGPERA